MEPMTKSKSAHAPMTLDDIGKLESKAQDAIEASEAGAAMAGRRWHDPPLPRAARVWTGRLAGRRAWRGQPVVLPDNTIAYVFAIQRGLAALWRPAPFKVAGREELLLPVEQIVPYTLPSAVRLGKCKAGHREAPSTRKAEACRRNGARPVRPGHRPRGRPRKVQSITDPPRQHPLTRPVCPDRRARIRSSASGGIPPACP